MRSLKTPPRDANPSGDGDPSGREGAPGVALPLGHERAEVEVWARLRGELHARLVHELKVPLFDISLNTSVLDRQRASTPEADARRADCTAQIRAALARVNVLIASLLDVDRFGAGEFAMNPRLQPVAEMVSLAAEVVAPLARARGVALTTRVHESVRGLVCDHGQMVRALTTLLANGLRRSPRGGRVQLAVSDTGISTHFAVRDGGDPVDDDAFARLVTLGEGAWATSPPGLSVASRVVALHGGTLEVRNEGGVVAFDAVMPSGHLPR